MLRYIVPKGIQWAAFPAVGFYLGWIMDQKETERMVLFRDKSALYARDTTAEDYVPTWP